MGIINERFMLKNKTAEELYEKYAKDMPIIDYHCHLSPKQIAEDYRFRNAYDLFLSGDHYKWRQMRSNGVEEKYITGDAPEYEKFLAFAKTHEKLIGNPLFHWTQLELKRYFEIDEILCENNAKKVWDICNEKLASDGYTARGLILRSNVSVICTTDDPADDLSYHSAIRNMGDSFPVKVLPTFRPDKLVDIGKPDWKEYIRKTGVNSYEELISYVKERIKYFADMGCRLSDHGVDYVPYAVGNPEAVFDKKMRGEKVSAVERDVFRTAVMLCCAREYADNGFAMQLHMGVIRNNNRRMFESIGADTGFDSIGDFRIADNLSAFLSALDYENKLPKTILYSLNPCDNYVLGTMTGNFQKAPYKGKIQLGAGWWFNDQRDGMEAQMKSLANLGMLANFVGMLTDSRSFVSYTRHEYFRRILCNLIGKWVEEGEYPNDDAMLSKIIRGICYENAKEYFNF